MTNPAGTPQPNRFANETSAYLRQHMHNPGSGAGFKK